MVFNWAMTNWRLYPFKQELFYLLTGSYSHKNALNYNDYIIKVKKYDCVIVTRISSPVSSRIFYFWFHIYFPYIRGVKFINENSAICFNRQFFPFALSTFVHRKMENRFSLRGWFPFLGTQPYKFLGMLYTVLQDIL